MNRDNLSSWIRKLEFTNKYTLPGLTYRFNAIPIKIPTEYFGELDILILTFKQIGRGPRIVKTTLKEGSGEGLALSDTRTYF